MPSQFFDSATNAKQRLRELKNIFLQVHDSIYLVTYPQRVRNTDHVKIDDLPFPQRVKVKLHEALFSNEVTTEGALIEKIKEITGLFDICDADDPYVGHVDSLLKALLDAWYPEDPVEGDLELMKLTCDRVCRDVPRSPVYQPKSFYGCCC